MAGTAQQPWLFERGDISALPLPTADGVEDDPVISGSAALHKHPTPTQGVWGTSGSPNSPWWGRDTWPLLHVTDHHHKLLYLRMHPPASFSTHLALQSLFPGGGCVFTAMLGLLNSPSTGRAKVQVGAQVGAQDRLH